MAFSEVFPLNVVRKNSLQLYQVELSNWGNQGASGDANSIISPIFDFSLAGLAIDPESTVTSVIVRPVSGNPPTLNPSGNSMPADFIVDKNNPFFGRLTFPRIRPYNGRWGLVAYNGDRYGDVATAESGLPLNPFGGALPAFTKPTLKLIMFVDALPPRPSVPNRVPYRRQLQVTSNVLGPTRVAIEPMSGRRFIRITASPGAAIPGITTCSFRGFTPGPGVGVKEFDGLAPSFVVDPVGTPGAVKSVLIENPAAHYLEVLLGSSIAGPMTIVNLTIDMFDN